jgi:hypothetical protein
MEGVHLLSSGFDVDLTMCPQCVREIADIDDFKTAAGAEILSK